MSQELNRLVKSIHGAFVLIDYSGHKSDARSRHFSKRLFWGLGNIGMAYVTETKMNGNTYHVALRALVADQAKDKFEKKVRGFETTYRGERMRTENYEIFYIE